MQRNQNNYCDKCGAKLAENAQFCETCGAPIEPVIQQPQNNNETIIENVSNFKSFASSLLVLGLAVLSTICVIFNIINFNLIPLVTSILMTIGCWLLWVNSRNIAGDPTGGLKLIKASVKVNYIVEIVVLSIVAIVSLLLLVASGAIADIVVETLGDTEVGPAIAGALGVILIILVIVIAIVIVISVMFYKSVLRFLDALIDSLGKGPKEAVEKAMLPAVFIIVLAGINLLNVLSSMASVEVANEFLVLFAAELPAEYAVSIPVIESSSFVPQLILACTNIYAGILIIIYKNKFSK